MRTADSSVSRNGSVSREWPAVRRGAACILLALGLVAAAGALPRAQEAPLVNAAGEVREGRTTTCGARSPAPTGSTSGSTAGGSRGG